MLSTSVLPSPVSSGFITGDILRPRSERTSAVCGAARRSDASIPKLEPFSRSRIDRWIPEPPLLKKTEDGLTDYCSTLEGDESSSCWRAYFELKDLEKELPKEDVEKLVRQAGGKKILIDCLHGITALQKKEHKDVPKPKSVNAKEEMHKPFPVPDGLPKTQEELEEEENARMPESPFTRLLRSMGRLPAWYSQAPDHETD
ncbi:CCG-binding protein 1 [Iris pallida]|uniref:CCG-binding protein 1 n=1 Tax=Iris pallida TaxID=29817 RepID=A0AAX6FKB3_IRIPA|nr:CCG-binding protein 1 [Iris pallida]